MLKRLNDISNDRLVLKANSSIACRTLRRKRRKEVNKIDIIKITKILYDINVFKIINCIIELIPHWQTERPNIKTYQSTIPTPIKDSAFIT